MIAPETLLQNRYQVREQIGRGGMGAVYIATDQRFGSTVALKETFFDDPSLRRAFEREARLLNHLRHAALPRVSDHFSEDEGQFLVMEYIPGDDLSDMLQKRGSAFPIADVLAWADQLLDALDYLHTQEPPVIHRDIKPQNLKLTARKQIVLLDFGLAKGTPSQTRVTATGSVFGYSRNYAPLEQMHGTGTDTRSDLYSLAATLYHLSTGQIPPDALSRATAVLNAQPDPLRPADELHPQVPPAVAEVFTRAMSQSAAARPQTAEEMRSLLREAARQADGARASSAATTLVAPAVGPHTANMQEQETRLLDGTSRGGAARATVAGGAEGKESAGALDAATMMNAPTRTADRATEAAAALTGAAYSASTSASGAADSIVTRVAPLHTPHAETRRGLSGRTLGAVASVVLLCAVAGAYYAYTLGPSPRTTTPPASAPAPLKSEPPAASSAPASQPATEADAGASAPAAPQEPSEPTTVVIKKLPDPAQKGAKRASQKPESTEDNDDEAEVEVPEVVVPDVNVPEIPEKDLQGVDWANPAQRERAMRRIRRAVRAQQIRAQRQQREAERLRRRQQTPPAPPRP